jgi:hypothetical protein
MVKTTNFFFDISISAALTALVSVLPCGLVAEL